MTIDWKSQLGSIRISETLWKSIKKQPSSPFIISQTLAMPYLSLQWCWKKATCHSLRNRTKHLCACQHQQPQEQTLCHAVTATTEWKNHVKSHDSYGGSLLLGLFSAFLIVLMLIWPLVYPNVQSIYVSKPAHCGFHQPAWIPLFY